MELPRINLHIHSKFSDGRNSIDEIVRKAIKLEMDYIGITDHFSNSWKANVIPTLNSLNKIQLYLQQIDECQDYLGKEQGLIILKGIEVDLSSTKSYIIRNLNPFQFDLILFEYLESYEGLQFIQSIINHWKNAKSPSTISPLLILAHFDPSLFIYSEFNPLINFLRRNDIIFEFNSSYSHFYAKKNELFFQKLKEQNIMVSIGCDSHNLFNLASIEEPYDMIRYYQLEKNLYKLIEKLDKIHRI
jgi:DNA polymerase (family 10)